VLLTVQSNNKIIIISLFCPHCWGTGLPYGLLIRRTGHNPPREPSAGWWVLTTAYATGTNGFTCLPKHGGARDKTFLVTHPMTDQRCLTSTIASRSALTAKATSSSTTKCLEIIKDNLGPRSQLTETWRSGFYTRLLCKFDPRTAQHFFHVV
jgi:hypothetical protein